MEKVNPEVIIINDDNDYDGIQCKPSKTKKKRHKKKKRKVEKSIDTLSNTETLIVTQKVRRQKIQCIINLTNICEYREKQKHKDKQSKAKAKEVKLDKIVPNCLRNKCRYDVKRKNDDIESRHQKNLNIKEQNESCVRGKLNDALKRKKSKVSCKKSKSGKTYMSSEHKHKTVITRSRKSDLPRCLSPISSVNLSDVLSECEEDILSYEDISSDTSTEINTLIKRSKDRERKCSHNVSYEVGNNLLQSSTSVRSNHDAMTSAKVNKNKINDLLSFEKSNILCAVTGRQNYDCAKNIANIPILNADKPSNVFEQIIDIEEPRFTSTSKDTIELIDTSATDDGTVLTSEMDIVSFHSQATLVLNSTESPSLKYDAYSPIMSPAFFCEEGVDNLQSHCVPTHLMSPALAHFIQNSANEKVFQKDEPYTPSESPFFPLNMVFDQNLKEHDSNKLESHVKQEFFLSPNLKEEAHIPNINSVESIENFASNYFKIDHVKSECIPGTLYNDDHTFESTCNYVNIGIKEEITEDSINNYIKLQPYSL